MMTIQCYKCGCLWKEKDKWFEIQTAQKLLHPHIVCEKCHEVFIDLCNVKRDAIFRNFFRDAVMRRSKRKDHPEIGDVFGVFTIIQDVPRELWKNPKEVEYVIKCDKGGIHQRQYRSFAYQPGGFCSFCVWEDARLKNPNLRKKPIFQKILDLEIFGDWKIIKKIRSGEFGTTWFECICNCCGEKKEITSTSIRKNKIPDCAKKKRFKVYGYDVDKYWEKVIRTERVDRDA